MLEVYVALTLLGLGVLLKKTKTTPAMKNIVPTNQKPSMQNIYKSDYTNTVRQKEAMQIEKHNNKIVSQLAGIEVDKINTNMFPFLRGGVKQNTNDNANVGIMEAFGTKNDIMFRKQELGGMFVPEPNIKPFTLENIDDITTRIAKPLSKKNVLPFQQERVGRGIDSGYCSHPTGGFQQTDLIDKIMPNLQNIYDVDKLRVANKPKIGGVEGRIIDGQKSTRVAYPGKMVKRHVDTAFEMKPERLLVTTGAHLKEKQKDVVIPKDTSRIVSSSIYGNAFAKEGDKQRGEVKPSNRQNLASFQTANIIGKRDNTDYGKASVQIYKNGRDVTTTQTYKGNVQSLIKSIISPIQDVLNITKKEFFLDPTREFGQLNVQIPPKITVHDPNDVARTTIKETTIHDSESLNFKGSTKLTVYDPADIARTTARQTMIQDSENMNMAAHVYKTNVFDPNAVARTTVKETLLQDTDVANMRKIEERGKVYVPGDKTRATVRQTLDLPDKNLNLASVQVHKGSTYDPNATARVTIKETTMNEDHRGIASGVVNTQNSAYVDATENLMIKGTQQASYNDIDYYGGAQIGTGGEGYKDAYFEVKDTMKQDPEEYYGIAADQTVVAARLQDDANAQTFKGNKEIVERAPTNEGVKLNMDSYQFGQTDVKRMQLQNDFALGIMPNTVANDARNDINLTKVKQYQQQEDTRLDMEILEPFKKNPFTQSLHSFA